MYLLLLPLLVIVYQESLMVHGLKYMPPSNSLTRLVTPQTKPILYVYDHCPFCVRVRLAFGLKNIKHEVRFLANDDVDTPTKLIGKKGVPILQFGYDGPSMPESLDIIEKIDSDPTYGPIRMIKTFSSRTDLKDWQAKIKDIASACQRPRYMMVPLPEFHQRDSKEAFVSNHPLPGYEKQDWKNNLTSEKRWQLYIDSYKESIDKNYVEFLNKALVELDQLIHCEKCCTEGGVSLDDIDLFARLRSLTLIKGIKFPKKIHDYMTTMSELGDIPLYDTMQV